MSVKIRRWGEFFNTNKFSLPPGLSSLLPKRKGFISSSSDDDVDTTGHTNKLLKNLNKLATRVESNLLYFQVNYTLILLLAVLYMSIQTPLALLGLLVGAVMVGYILQHPIIKLQGRTFNQEQAYIATAAITFILVFALSGIVFLKCFFYSLAFIVLHATFRTHTAKASFINWYNRITGQDQLEDLFSPTEELETDALPKSQRRQHVTSYNPVHAQDQLYDPYAGQHIRSRNN